MCMIDDADPCDFEVSEYPRARKEHRCEECGRAIQPGERYRRTAQKFDGYVSAWKTCAHCEAAASYLVEHCNGYVVGGVREDLEEHWCERAPDRLFLARAIVGIRRQWSRRDGALMLARDLYQHRKLRAQRDEAEQKLAKLGVG